jgi:hypothetical protein
MPLGWKNGKVINYLTVRLVGTFAFRYMVPAGATSAPAPRRGDRVNVARVNRE